MKPRLEPCAWTSEDTDIWVRVLERRGLYWYATTLEWFQGQDRRDAALMLEAGLWRWALDYYVRRPDTNAHALSYHTGLYRHFLATGERPGHWNGLLPI